TSTRSACVLRAGAAVGTGAPHRHPRSKHARERGTGSRARLGLDALTRKGPHALLEEEHEGLQGVTTRHQARRGAVSNRQPRDYSMTATTSSQDCGKRTLVYQLPSSGTSVQ